MPINNRACARSCDRTKIIRLKSHRTSREMCVENCREKSVGQRIVDMATTRKKNYTRGQANFALKTDGKRLRKIKRLISPAQVEEFSTVNLRENRTANFVTVKIYGTFKTVVDNDGV